MRGPSLKPEMIDRILRFEKVRVPPQIISDVTGVEFWTVKRVIERFHKGKLKFIQHRSHGYDPEIARRKAAGESHSQIAAAMGICKSTVTKRIGAGLPGAAQDGRHRLAGRSVEPPAPPPS